MPLPAARLIPSAPPEDSAAPLFAARPDLAMVFVSAGALRIETQDQRAIVPHGHMACVPAGLPHRIDGAVDAEAVVLSIGGELAAGLAPFVGARPRVHKALPVMLEMVLDAATWADAPPSPEVVRCWRIAFAGLAPRWCSPSRPLTLPLGETPELRTALRHLLPRLERPVGLPDAARAAEVSPRTIQRRCATELGEPLSSWMTRARLLHAVEHLSHHGDSVGVIAARVGYQSAAAFTRAFTGLLDSTPSNWRPRR